MPAIVQPDDCWLFMLSEMMVVMESAAHIWVGSAVVAKQVFLGKSRGIIYRGW
jgi:hypothetical protein